MHLSIPFYGGTDVDTLKSNADIDAHYPGGKASWNLFFTKKFKYPYDAELYGIDHVVKVSFIISEKGSIKNAKIIDGIDKTYDKAILKVVNMMPNWTPFLKDGVPIEVPFELNIPLHLNSPAETFSAANPNEIVTTPIEHQPEFLGGEYALNKFLHDKLNYPVTAQETQTQGVVYIGFVVRSNGKLTDIKVIKGIGYGLDEESLRVVELMPYWIPGEDNGKTVSVYHLLPVKFQLIVVH